MKRSADRRSPVAGNAGQGMKWIRHTTRRRIYWRDGMCCVYCGSGYNLSLDHVVPRAKGGSNRPSNLLTACLACNERRGETPLLIFAFTHPEPVALAILDRWLWMPALPPIARKPRLRRARAA